MKSLQRTAYHEAAHAVLAYFLRVGLRRVTVVADEDSEGASFDGGEFSEDTEELRLHAKEAFWLRMATVRYAGAEAVRRLAPRSKWRDGATNDYRWASIALEKITLDSQSLRALQTYTMRRSRLLVENYWPEIESLARALIQRKELDGVEAVKEMLASLNDRPARRLMSY